MLIVGVSVQTGAADPPPTLLPLDDLPQEPVVALELTPIDETELPEPVAPGEPAALDAAVPDDAAPAKSEASTDSNDSGEDASEESTKERVQNNFLFLVTRSVSEGERDSG